MQKRKQPNLQEKLKRYTKEGVIQLIASFVTCGLAGVIPFIEGIIYLTKSDEEFYNTYQVGKKAWF